MTKNNYPEHFFDAMNPSSLKSAKEILPIVVKLLNPKSVIDVGCGEGTWLSVFQKYGITDFLGIDGDYINPSKLKIPKQKYKVHDLNTPLRLEKKFDLVICLEVAEHLPENNARIFINSLTRLGNSILFSAAIPYQPGYRHVNCQWPDYWKHLFDMKGFIQIDCIRERIWNNKNVNWWYSQNTFLYVRNKKTIRKVFLNKSVFPNPAIHEGCYLEVIQCMKQKKEIASI